MSKRAFKFQIDLEIEKVTLALAFECKLSVIWKRGNQRLESKQPDLKQNQAIFNEKLTLTSTLFQDSNGVFAEKKSQITITLITVKGNKVAGQCFFDVSSYLNNKAILNKQVIRMPEQFRLEKCPDKNAKCCVVITLTMLSELDMDAMSQMTVQSHANDDSLNSSGLELKHDANTTASSDSKPQQESIPDKSKSGLDVLKQQLETPEKKQNNDLKQQSLDEQLNELKIQNSKLQEMKDAAEIRLIKLQNDLKNQKLSYERQIQTVKTDATHALTLIQNQFEKRESALNQTIQDYVKQIGQSKSNTSSSDQEKILQQIIDHQQQQINDFENKLNSKAAQMKDTFEITLNGYKSQFEQKDLIIEQLQTKLKGQQVIEVSKPKLEADQKQLNQVIVEQNAKINEFLNTQQKYKEDVNSLTIKLNQATEQLKKYSSKNLENLQEQTQEFTQKLDEQQKVIFQLNSTIKEQELQINGLNHQVENLKSEFQQATYNSNQKIEELNLELQNKVNEMYEQQYQSQVEQNTILQANQKITNMNQQLQLLETEQNKIKQEQTKNESIMKNQEGLINILQAQLQQQQLQTIAKEKQQVEDFNHNLQSKVDEITKLQQQLKQEQDTTLSANQKVNDIKKQAQLLETKYKELRAEYAKCQQLLKEQENLIKAGQDELKIQQKQATLSSNQLVDSLKSQLDSKGTQITKLQQQLSVEQNTIIELNQSIFDLNKQLQELETQLSDLKSDYATMQQSKDNEIKIVHMNYNHRLELQVKQIESLQLQINQQAQDEDEQKKLIKFLESVKDKLESKELEQVDYIQQIQQTNENCITQIEQKEAIILQIQKEIDQVKQNLDEQSKSFEQERVDISKKYQNIIMDTSNLAEETELKLQKETETLQDQVIHLKCKIGEMFNAAQEVGGSKLVDKLQNALGLREE